jgi:branched-chain amino acid transport system substrate-binding protein
VVRSQPLRRSIVLLVVAAASFGAVAATVPTASAAPHQARLVATYRIGFEGPLSGSYAQIGLNERNGARLAIAQANAAGNLPFDLALTSVDDQGDPVKAPAAATVLINNPDVKGVVGPSFSGATEATGAAYQGAHLALANPSATNPDLSHHGWRVFHRLVPSDPVEGVLAADWLARRGTQRMIVIQDRTAYGVALGNATTHEARAKGIHVTYLARDGFTTTKYSPLAHRIISAGVHTVFYAGYDVGAAKLAKALHRAGYHGLRVSGNGVRISAFTSEAGAAGNGYYAVCGCMTKYASLAQQAFATAYRAKYHSAPGLFSAQAYDAAHALIRAIKVAVAGGHTSRAAINVSLGNVDFAGVSTRVKFARDGDIARSAARVNLFRVRQREFRQIGDIRRLG